MIKKRITSIALCRLLSFGLVALLLFGCVSVLGGCTDKSANPYNDKEVTQIRTQIRGGETVVDAVYTRTFDFSTGKITDEAVVCDEEIEILLAHYNESSSAYPECDSIEQYEEYLCARYNNPKQVGVFTKEQADGFLKKAISAGIYTWADSYTNKEIVDASSLYFTIVFSDGIEKTTRFYCNYPKNFKKIEAAFKDYFGVELQFD